MLWFAKNSALVWGVLLNTMLLKAPSEEASQVFIAPKKSAGANNKESMSGVPAKEGIPLVARPSDARREFTAVVTTQPVQQGAEAVERVYLPENDRRCFSCASGASCKQKTHDGAEACGCGAWQDSRRSTQHFLGTALPGIVLIGGVQQIFCGTIAWGVHTLACGVCLCSLQGWYLTEGEDLPQCWKKHFSYLNTGCEEKENAKPAPHSNPV